jgi:ParB-like chromosome segregation protein Spo0J
MKIEQIPTADLIHYARNTRTHSPEQVAQIAGSIREFGFTNEATGKTFDEMKAAKP